MNTEQERVELLPCPFCGGEATLKQYRSDGLRIECQSCRIKYEQRWLYKNRDWLTAQMAKTWNTRAALQSQSLTVDDLAQEIRRVDGKHSLGAGALAEALMPFIQSALQSQDPEDRARLDWLESCEEGHGFCHTGYGEYRYYAHQTKGFPSVREAIDHARRIEGDGE